MIMVVPGPGRRQDQVAGLHVALVAFHGGVRAFPLQHPADGRGRMPVGRGALPRQQQLQGRRDGMGGAVLQSGVSQP